MKEVATVMPPQASSNAPGSCAKSDAGQSLADAADLPRNTHSDGSGHHSGPYGVDPAVTWWVHDSDTGILADWSIPRHADYVPDARRHVRKLAETVLRHGNRAHDVEVCASEALSNAVLHGGGDEVQIIVSVDETTLGIEITDEGSGGVPYLQSDAAESGRGLLIVAALADQWSYTVEPDTGRLSVAIDFDIEPGRHLGTRDER